MCRVRWTVEPYYMVCGSEPYRRGSRVEGGGGRPKSETRHPKPKTRVPKRECLLSEFLRRVPEDAESGGSIDLVRDSVLFKPETRNSTTDTLNPKPVSQIRKPKTEIRKLSETRKNSPKPKTERTHAPSSVDAFPKTQRVGTRSMLWVTPFFSAPKIDNRNPEP